MLDEIKKKLFLERVKLLTLNGLVTGQIVPFDPSPNFNFKSFLSALTNIDSSSAKNIYKLLS